MRTCIITIVVLFVLEILGKFTWLQSAKIPQRGPLHIAADILITGALAIWGATLVIG